MNKRILISLSVIGVAAAIAVGGTIAYFSDTETSVGNTFTAGAIDLKIDNESYVTNEDGVLAYSQNTSWGLKDLGETELFFDFSDLKPGDIGEDTISLHVNSNDAWACMNIALTGTPENDQTEPETEVDFTTGDDEGELQNELYFAFWADDGDNVFEDDEEIFAEGLAASLFNGLDWTLADSTKNVWSVSGGPLQGGENEQDYHVGKVWCYGALTEDPVEVGEDTPIERGTGFVCDGSSVTNASQTDGIVANVEFYAEQSRNNANFKCSKEFVLTHASTQNPINQANGTKPWYSYAINGLCIDFTLHNPTGYPAYFDYAIDGDPGYFVAGVSDVIAHEGPYNLQALGNLHINNTNVPAGQTVTVERCGNSEIKIAIHYGAEQLWYLDWATFTAQ
jgi:predicted ribosomally synthesized peptide with SipW-like signal peptide